jgi:FkbM family methyltransferase
MTTGAGPRLTGWKRRMRHALPRRSLQPLFERLHGLSLAGLGIGSAVWDFDESGEQRFIDEFAAWAVARSGHVTVVDVGANEGGYAQRVHSAMRGSCTIHCFEPARETFEDLARRLGGTPGVSLHHCAVGARSGSASLHTVPGHSQIASLHPFDDRPSAVEESVRVTTLDEWAMDTAVEHVDLAKVDVEGVELEVLSGASALLDAGAIDVIQFEYGARNLHSGASLKDFYDALPGYSIHRLVIDGLTGPLRYRDTLERPISATNYVAVREGLSTPWG